MKQKTKFKQTEIGMIPEDWEEVIFSDKIDVNPKRDLERGTAAKFVSMADIEPFQRKITKYILREFKGGAKFRNGDTLFARITPCLENGKTAFVDILDENEIGFGSTEFIILSGKKGETDPYFVYYLSRSPEIRNVAIQSMTGTSGRQRVENDVFSNIILNLPPLPEQRAIAKILSDIDSKIELLQAQNKTLEAIGQALFKHWFVDFEFPDENGTPYKSSGGRMVESELGEIPKGWEVERLSNLLESIESGRRPKGGIDPTLKDGVPSIGAENVNGLGFYDYSSTKYVSQDFFEQMEQGVIRDNDVLLYKDGAYLGRKTMFGKGFPFDICCVNEHVFILRVNEKINQFFLYFWLDQNVITENIKNLNANSAQPGINKESVGTLKVLVPELEIINNFKKIIEIAINKVFLNCLESKNLSQIRDSLLPKLMSGKIRVPVEVKS